MIDYFQKKFTPMPDPSSCRAMVQSRGTFSTDDVIHELIRRGSSVGEADIAAVLSQLIVVILDAVLENRKHRRPQHPGSAHLEIMCCGVWIAQVPCLKQI